MLPAAPYVIPVSVSVLYLLYKYVRSRGKTELSHVLSDSLHGHLPTERHHFHRDPPSDHPAPSDHPDPAILDEIRKLDPAVLELIRKLDLSVLDEIRKLDSDGVDDDPAVLDQIRKLCLKEEENQTSCGEGETKSENERESEESNSGSRGGGGEGDKKNKNGGGGGGDGGGSEAAEKSSKKYKYPMRDGDCWNYIKFGTCKFGSTCKYYHPPRPWKTNQYDGKAGSFDHKVHKPGDPSVAPVLELNFLDLPIRPGEKMCSHYMRYGSCKYGSNCRFNHPDPRAAGEPDHRSGCVTGGPASLQGASSSMAARGSASTSFNGTPLYEPTRLPPSQGIPFQNTEWTGYLAPAPERSTPAPPPHVMNNSRTGTKAYEQYPQPKRVEDCGFKSNCKDHNPKNQTAESPPCALSDKGLPLRPGQSICTDYTRSGFCNLGPACIFDHPSLSTFFL